MEKKEDRTFELVDFSIHLYCFFLWLMDWVDKYRYTHIDFIFKISWTRNSKTQLTLPWTDLFNIHFCTLITVCKLKRAWWESSLAASATAYHAGKITISCFFLAILPTYYYIFESFELPTKFAIRFSNFHEFFTIRPTFVCLFFRQIQPNDKNENIFDIGKSTFRKFGKS